MNDETAEQTTTIHDFAEAGAERMSRARSGLQDAVAATADYIRANPWVAVAGAAVIGGVVAGLSKPCKREPHTLDAVRDWLDEAYAKLPSQKQVETMVQTSDLPDFLANLRKKIGF